MNKLVFSGLLSLTLGYVNAQQGFNCNSHNLFEQRMQNDLSFKANQLQLENETQDYIQAMGQSKAVAATYIIPVVFHIIHTGGSGNISDAQVIDQINILNKEFNRQQADTILTPSIFKPMAAPFSVEFRLATKDPNGNCTNGINRIFSTLSDCSVKENDVKSLSYWPSNKYLNIWIVQSMHYSGSTTCDGGGHASFPGGPANLDGINIRGDLISNIGTSASNTLWGNFKGRYLIHELGHWFNLRHIWGDATCGNDLVNDTPPHVNANSGCPNFPHNPSSACAGSNPSGEMFTNYMDYTNGNCLNMFTAGQVARMTAAINSGVSGRNNLWTPANLLATGTNDPYTYPIACVAVPQIFPYEPIVICAGDSATFTDKSYGGQISSRQWDFGGQPASSLTDSVVKVKYDTPGVYSLTLTNSFSGSTKTSTFVNRVHVIGNAPNLSYYVPFKDSLEDVFGFPNDWVIVNRDNDATTWEHNMNTSYSGSYCVGIMNFDKQAPLVDDLITPAYDLTAVENPTLSFRLHFATRANSNTDKLQIYISNNCGKTWNSIYSKTAASNLKTINTNITSSFIPSVGSNEWRLEKINIFNFLASGVVRFKFSFTSGGGNNIFLDDINVDGFNTTGIKNYYISNVSVFPNPSAKNLNIKYNLSEAKPVTLEIMDITGRVCLSEKITTIRSGENNTTIDLSHLTEGAYLLKMKQDNAIIFSTRIIKDNQE